jgi:lipoyl(octanoyl) transferase
VRAFASPVFSRRSDFALATPRLALRAPFPAVPGSPPVEWRVEAGLVAYPQALAEMESRAVAFAAGRAAERVWLIEHPPLYTSGTSAKPADLLDARFPVYRAGRGGQFTYHGPGQRVAYVMLDLKRRRPDVRAYVAALEGWLIDALAALGVEGETREDRVGVWVARPDKPPGLDGAPAEDKIAAIGVRVRRWTTFHGAALNVAPDLSHFSGIAPCGIHEAHYGVTSLADLGRAATLADADRALRASFEARFGPTVEA